MEGRWPPVRTRATIAAVGGSPQVRRAGATEVERTMADSEGPDDDIAAIRARLAKAEADAQYFEQAYVETKSALAGFQRIFFDYYAAHESLLMAKEIEGVARLFPVRRAIRDFLRRRKLARQKAKS